jgi:hypothetical protein
MTDLSYYCSFTCKQEWERQKEKQNWQREEQEENADEALAQHDRMEGPAFDPGLMVEEFEVETGTIVNKSGNMHQPSRPEKKQRSW